MSKIELINNLKVLLSQMEIDYKLEAQHANKYDVNLIKKTIKFIEENN